MAARTIAIIKLSVIVAFPLVSAIKKISPTHVIVPNSPGRFSGMATIGLSGVEPSRGILVRGGEDSTTLGLSTTILSAMKTVAPRLGTFTSIAVVLSPAAAVLKAVRLSSLGDLNPLPLAFMAVSATSWLAYGLAVRDPFLVLANLAGCITSIGYVAGVLPLLGGGGEGGAAKLRVMQAVVVGGTATCLCLWTFLILSNSSADKANAALGFFASGLFVVLAVSPLSTIGEVVRNKDSSSILAPLMVAQVTNSALWSAYGIIIKDQFLSGSSILGLFLGLLQLVLKLMFPSKKLHKLI